MKISRERLLGAGGLAALILLLGGLVAFLDSVFVDWADRDLERRSRIIWTALEHEIPLHSEEELRQTIENLTTDDRLVGIVVCAEGRQISNDTLPSAIHCRSSRVRAAAAAGGSPISVRIGRRDLQLTARRINGAIAVIAQDQSFLGLRRDGVFRILFVGAFVILVLAYFIYRFGTRSARQSLSRKLRDVVLHIEQKKSVPREVPQELQPIVEDLGAAVRRLRQRRAGLEETSGPERLRRYVEEHMPDTSLVLVANREPYVHERDEDGDIKVKQPPSGLVTGVEPLLRACGGTWIAHGAGSADRETSDARGRVAVPPENPEYVLRRMWLTEREEEGYYYGFSNEGLWPLCHIAHTRPTFRAEDWQEYQNVNARFARAAVEEAGPKGLILCQDYHFALLPREIRSLAPESVVSLFWHIPWPNAEVVGICPWKRELLDGMLGADVIGFHTRFHCLNFLETAQRFLECRVDFASMSIEYKGHHVWVKENPISIDWPYPAAPREEGRALRKQLGLSPDLYLAVGVDRADYTKGLLERIAGVETLLSQNPDLIGRFQLVQLAAPSRTHIKKYRDLISDLEEAVAKVNRRFGRAGYRPVFLQLRSFSPSEVRTYYAMSDCAVVTPLHDGMNLVAKEYAASCSDGHGALILSTFAGAARELEGALVVNPYDAQEIAQALRHAVDMTPQEQRARLESMQAAIGRNTIYDWAEKLLRDMAEVWERRNKRWEPPARVDETRLNGRSHVMGSVR